MVRLAIGQRRELLLAAAWRVMIRGGVAAATTRAICAEAGMPQSSFHYCFDSRIELLKKTAVTSRLPAHLARASETIEQTDTAEERVHRTMEAYWQDVVGSPSHHAVLYDITMTSYYDPELKDLAGFQYQAYHQATREILQMAESDGKFRWDADIDELTVGLVAFLDGITLRYLAEPSNPRLHEGLLDYGRGLLQHLEPVASA